MKLKIMIVGVDTQLQTASCYCNCQEHDAPAEVSMQHVAHLLLKRAKLLLLWAAKRIEYMPTCVATVK